MLPLLLPSQMDGAQPLSALSCDAAAGVQMDTAQHPLMPGRVSVTAAPMSGVLSITTPSSTTPPPAIVVAPPGDAQPASGSAATFTTTWPVPAGGSQSVPYAYPTVPAGAAAPPGGAQSGSPSALPFLLRTFDNKERLPSHVTHDCDGAAAFFFFPKGQIYFPRDKRKKKASPRRRNGRGRPKPPPLIN